MKIEVGNKPYRPINPSMIGLFFEDINYAADGGLYAEMLENRSFSFVKAEGDWADYYTVPAGDYGWSLVNESRGEFRIVSGSPLSENNPGYARLQIFEKGFGIKNKAYEGLFVSENSEYNVVFWARAKKYEGKYNISIEKDGKVLGKASVNSNAFIDSKYNLWKLYQTTIKVCEEASAADFIFSFDETGTVELAYVSLIPCDAEMGIFRKDLYTLLKELKPGFIRFPGGCIIEGNTLSNRYNYKNTLMPTWDRKTNWNRWAVHGNCKEKNYVGDYAWYNQTLGLGFYEYFLLCESIGAKPLPVLNVGLACQYQSNELVSIDSKEFKEFVQDALDLIEFANGDPDSKWGAVRKAMGHSEPFGLEFMGIGNEQWQTEKVDFFERYLIFEKTIHEKYPDIKLIGSAGPDITSERYTMAWDFYRKHKDIENFAFALDEHYYVKPEYLFEHNDFYDDYDRDIKVFSGEYAAHPFSGFNRYDSNTLYGALSEAAFMTGVERNADVVVLASYAPLFARVNYAQWAPDMIWFDGKISYGSPSYFVQKMYANNMGTATIEVKNVKEAIAEGVYYNISLDERDNSRIIKIVNATENAKKIELSVEGKYSDVVATTLYSDDKDAYNCIENPCRVTTKEYSIDDITNITLEPYSFTVLRF